MIILDLNPVLTIRNEDCRLRSFSCNAKIKAWREIVEQQKLTEAKLTVCMSYILVPQNSNFLNGFTIIKE